MTHTSKMSHIAAYAEAFYLANLLFVGVFYVLLWILFLWRFHRSDHTTQVHLKQTLIASSFSTCVAIVLNIIIIFTSGYASATALIVGEIYLMAIVPLCFFFGLRGFIKAINNEPYYYPLIATKLGLINTA